jgi:hypothetical protein
VVADVSEQYTIIHAANAASTSPSLSLSYFALFPFFTIFRSPPALGVVVSGIASWKKRTSADLTDRVTVGIDEVRKTVEEAQPDVLVSARGSSK